MKQSRFLRSHRSGFTMMEILVVVAIVVTLAAVVVPTIDYFRGRGERTEALARMRALVATAKTYIGDHNDELPMEDAMGTDSWQAVKDPENKEAWYNALPVLMGRRSVADLADSPREFYTKANPLYLPGAKYPDSDKKLVKPLFAFAINGKLQQKDAEGKKARLKSSNISDPSRTVLFLEQGLPAEADAKHKAPVQTKNNFNGSPKGNAKSFVGRYGGKGWLAFVDGRMAEFEPQDLLTESGGFPFPPTEVIWCRTPEEDPNK
jgi:prepilin-type N-terminal cleavage/methylation domain-containing protein